MLNRKALEACLLLLTGMAVGATVAVLFAPESGVKTRLRIEEWNIWKQAKRRQERRYKRLPNLSKRTFCGRLPDPPGCRFRKRGAFCQRQSTLRPRGLLTSRTVPFC